MAVVFGCIWGVNYRFLGPWFTSKSIKSALNHNEVTTESCLKYIKSPLIPSWNKSLWSPWSHGFPIDFPKISHRWIAPWCTLPLVSLLVPTSEGQQLWAFRRLGSCFPAFGEDGDERPSCCDHQTWTTFLFWGVPGMGGTQQNGWLIYGKIPILDGWWLGGSPIFEETSVYPYTWNGPKWSKYVPPMTGFMGCMSKFVAVQPLRQFSRKVITP